MRRFLKNLQKSNLVISCIIGYNEQGIIKKKIQISIKLKK